MVGYNISTFFLQDNRVTDHRLKMNYELTSFLEGDIENAVQVFVLALFFPILIFTDASVRLPN